jgi:hypothetical protein
VPVAPDDRGVVGEGPEDQAEATRIRAYCEALAEIHDDRDDERRDWIAWARQHADRAHAVRRRTRAGQHTAGRVDVDAGAAAERDDPPDR